MPLVSRDIPNLINGVSQQPASIRLPSQAEEVINCMPSVVEGLRFRPPLEYQALLASGTLTGVGIHSINRDAQERYKVLFLQNKVRVFDAFTGVEKTVNYAEHTHTLLDAVDAVVTSSARRIYAEDSATTITLETSGISAGATVVWESAVAEDFSGTVTTLRTDTANAVGAVAWDPGADNGKYVRARVSAFISKYVTATVTWENVEYLNTATPASNITATTIADFTFVANRSVVCSMLGILSPSRGVEAIASIKQANYQTSYTVEINGTQFTHTTGSSGALSTSVIANALKTLIDASLSFTFSTQVSGSVLHIRRNDSGDFTVRAFDSRANTHIYFAKDSVQRFTDLPVTAPTGFTVRVAGEPESDTDDYYVRFVPNNEGELFDEGQWVETVAPGIPHMFDAATLPHKLVREADGTFTFGANAWEPRAAGDADTAPDPSFIGKTIRSLFYHKNRLAFLADTNTIMTAVTEFFNFWPETVTQVLDSGPIDIAASGSKVTKLNFGIPFNGSLLLFSSQQQSRMESNGLFTPANVSIEPTTSFEASEECEPERIGDSIFFPSGRGSFSTIMEYFVREDAETDDAAEVSAHIPRYIPQNVVKLSGAPNENIMVALCDGERGSLYAYKYFWSGDEKVQSAWVRWTFAGATILDTEFNGTALTLVVQRSDGVYLERLFVEDGRRDTGTEFVTSLDRRLTDEQCVSVVYSAVTGHTTFTLPYAVTAGATYAVVQRYDSGDAAALVGQEAQGVEATGSTVTVDGDWSARKVYIGERFEKSYTFSTLYMRDAQGQKAIHGGRLTLTRLTVVHDATANFTVRVAHAHRQDPSDYVFTGRVLGSSGDALGSPPISTGSFSVPVNGLNTDTVISVLSDSYLPMRLTSAVWEGHFHIRSRRF